jgi:hypothetical protein
MNGANIMELAKRVGHIGPEMINRVYAHLVDDLKKKEAFPIPRLYPFVSVDNSKVLDESIRRDEKEADERSPTS